MSRATKLSLVRPIVGFAAAGALVASAFVAAPAVATPQSEAPVVAASIPPEEFTFTAALNYNRRGLLAEARAISSPGTRKYRNFLSLQQAATKFGATRQQREGLRAAANRLGIRVSFSATGLTAQLTAPVETWNTIYGSEPVAIPSAPWVNYLYVDAQGNLPPVPGSLRPHLRYIFTDAAVLPPAPRSAVTPARATPVSTDDSPPVNTGTPFGPGAECIPAPALPYTYSPQQIHTPYGTVALQERGLRGAGARIANIGGGYAYTDEYLEYFADCFEFRAPPVRFTGGPGVGPDPVRTSGDDEGNLDVQVIAAVVPEIERIDYIQVSNAVALPLSFVQGIDIALTRLSPMPDVITSSFGACDLTLEGNAPSVAVSDDHFALAGVLGVSVLTAAGDGGSSACTQFNPDPPPGTEVPAVAYPGSSPWITAVGGTRLVLGEGNARVDEVVWNDTPWGGSSQGAGTGGSALAARPWYQKPVTAQDRRLVPDVAAHASEFAGWPAAGVFDGELMVVPFAGTSAASPLVAANLALLAAAERRAGRGPLGFVNPMLYALAEKPAVYKKAFYDVTEGSNQIFFEASCCVATKGYDQATGLGALTFDELIKVIPRPGRGGR
jgi:subtilase family serine protease